jgi:hypothetical protein
VQENEIENREETETEDKKEQRQEQKIDRKGGKGGQHQACIQHIIKTLNQVRIRSAVGQSVDVL